MKRSRCQEFQCADLRQGKVVAQGKIAVGQADQMAHTDSPEQQPEETEERRP